MTTRPEDSPSAPRIVPRAEHNISRARISEASLKVLYRLRAAGFGAYLVGGGVRDLLLGREPKDFDVATDALPEEVAELFSNSRLIGRRFKLVHVRFGRDIVEVATFRGAHEPDEIHDDGMILADNVYGTLEQDVWRRDFTVNALYYNIADFSVVDFVGGMQDLQAGVLRVIGDPRQRYLEDPVRMLRAVRFAAKLGFRIHPQSEAPLADLGERLAAVPPARLFDELLKLFLSGHALATFELLRHYDLFRYLFPLTDVCLAEETQGFPRLLVAKGLANTDARIAEDKPVTPAFLFAVLLWEPVRARAARLAAEGMSDIQALQRAGDEVIADQVRHIAVPKRFSLQTREIWSMQARLTRRQGKRAALLLESPRFRAAYDFLLLRAESGEPEQQVLADWWTAYQGADADNRGSLLKDVEPPRSGRKRPRRRRRKPARATTD